MSGLQPPSFEDIAAATRRIDPFALRTPLLSFPALDEQVGTRVLVKAEMLQRMGSFKFRGAYNKIAQLDARRWPGGVVTCSSGNHAQGVAEAARLRGLKAAIVMPRDAPAIKVARTKQAGGEVIFYNRAKEDREAIANHLAKERQAAFVAPYDDRDVIAGQGTIGVEIVEQAQSMTANVDCVLAPCSGGGLMSGIAIAVQHFAPKAELYAIEPKGFDDLARSIAKGRLERNPATDGSICDALLVPTPGVIAFEVLRKRLTGALSVSDEEAAEAVRYAFEELKLVVEPSGAVTLAALLSGRLRIQGQTVAIVLSGGNIDADLFAEIIGAMPAGQAAASQAS